MENVKIFYEDVHSSGGLEKQMNEWLGKMGEMIEITRTMQTATGRMSNHITITIFYKIG